jgi:hypothetical protein
MILGSKQVGELRFESAGMWRCVVLRVFPDVSKERSASSALSYAFPLLYRLFVILNGNYLQGQTVKETWTPCMRSFETSGTTYPTTLRHIPENLNIQQHRCEKLKSRL